MRFSRLLLTVVAVLAASLAVGWRVAASQHAPGARPAAAARQAAHPRYLLQLHAPQLAPRLGGGTCFVAGNCSETPCVLDIASQGPRAAPVVASYPVLARTAVARADEVPISGCRGRAGPHAAPSLPASGFAVARPLTVKGP